MTRRLVETLERALADTVQNFPRDASVLVQFKAGDLAELKEALAEARALLDSQPSVVKPGIVLQPEPEAPAAPAVSETPVAGAEGTTQPGEQPEA